jgi:16S rRNA (cytosine1402-N4)-methyltransferase
MLDEVLAALPLRPGALAADGTIGLAGHALAIAGRIRPGGLLLGMDWDETMLSHARGRLEQAGVEARLFHSDFRALPERLAEAAPGRLADAILLDLGLNSAQIEDPSRGISFLADGPLDMRMDRSAGEPASALLNRLSAPEIERILLELGDERWARRIALEIVSRRKDRPLRRTSCLVECVLAAVPPARRERRMHPATRAFMAVRLAVNRELDGLQEAIARIARCLAPGGAMAVLSYHSGEDRATKRALLALQATRLGVASPKPACPSPAEIARNPRSRSAKLRVFRRIQENRP